MKRFNEWFNSAGHWIYSSRDEAFAQWKSFGIDGLPAYAGQKLAD